MKTWAIVDQSNIILDVKASETHVPGTVECPDYLGIGMNITTAPPAGWKSQAQIAQEDEDALNTVRADPQVQNFVQLTPAQVDAYIDANAKNLAGVVAILKFLAKMILRLAKREYRDRG